MNNIKKKLLFYLSLVISLSIEAQNTFEKTITFEDGIVRECNSIVETADHGFIISCISIHEYGDNDALIVLSPEGEITATLLHQINGKNLKYCGLFRHPEYDNEFLAIATLIEESLVQNTFVFLHIDEELNVISENLCFMGDDYIHLNISTQEMPRIILEADSTVVVAAHCQKTEGYCYLFARISIDGQLIVSRNYSCDIFDYIYDFSAQSRNNYRLIRHKEEDAGSYIYSIDSVFNYVELKRLTGLYYNVVEYDPPRPYPDTTYMCSGEGNIVPYNDSLFVITSRGRFIKHLGGHMGNCCYLAIINDSCDVYNQKSWDIISGNGNGQYRLKAQHQAIGMTDDVIYHCGIWGIRDHLHYLSGSVYPSKIVVSKFDKELNLIWRRYFGENDNFYDINVIQITDDGGCGLSGICSKRPDYFDYYAYFLKVDANGFDAVIENEEIIARPYFCYPNPAKDNVYIEFSPDVNCQSVEIYTLDGHMVETCHGASLQNDAIDISNINAGVYIMKLRMADGKEFAERIVKE